MFSEAENNNNGNVNDNEDGNNDENDNGNDNTSVGRTPCGCPFLRHGLRWKHGTTRLIVNKKAVASVMSVCSVPKKQ